MPISRFVVAALLVACLSACTSIQSLYPDFDEYVTGRTSIDVIVDVLILDDIKGKSLGVDIAANTEYLMEAERALIQQLSEYGYSTNLIFAGSGVFFTPEEGQDYYYSNDRKSSDEPYIAISEREDGFESTRARDFFNVLVERAEADRKVRKQSQPENTDQETFLSDLNSLASFESDMVMYVRIEGLSVGMGKTIGLNLLTMTASGVLTGGTLVARPITTYHSLSMVVLDRRSGERVWSARFTENANLNIDNSIFRILNVFPLANGRYLSAQKIREMRQHRRAVKQKGEQ